MFKKYLERRACEMIRCGIGIGIIVRALLRVWVKVRVRVSLGGEG